MDRISHEDIIATRPMAFTIGPNGREFFMHSSLVASLSAPLEKFVRGPWVESVEKNVVWKEVDEATFVHFSQYAYTGTYYVQSQPSAILPPEREPERQLVPVVKVSAEEVRYLLERRKERREKTIAGPRGVADVIQSTFQQILADHQPLRNAAVEKVPTAAVSGVTECDSYGQIFLAHAKIHVFADCYGIEDLGAQALGKLYSAFMDIRVEDSDVLQLVEFYVQTELPEKLSELLMAYIGTRSLGLWANSRFQELLQQDDGMKDALLNMIMTAASVHD